MKGARGLLISITGGRDLTLYEVDEAATRIREEVDEDANIIVGATFDETLDGIIRVSVVATGIDQAYAERPAAPVGVKPPLGLDAARPPRGENGRGMERFDRNETARPAPPPMMASAASVNDSIEIGEGGHGRRAAAVGRPRRRPKRPPRRRFRGHYPPAGAQAFLVHRAGARRTGAA